MNSYLFGFLVEPTTPPVIGDAAGLARLCKQIGYLCFAPGIKRMAIGGRLGINTGAYTTTNVVGNNAAVEIAIESPYKLPSAQMPPQFGATTSGEITASAGGAIAAVTTAVDDKATTVITGLDRPIVTKGCGIVAYLPAGVDVSNELDAQVNIMVCNGQQLVIGTAVQDAMDGIYPTPFSSAWAIGIFGAGDVKPVTIMSVPSTRPMVPNNPRLALR